MGEATTAELRAAATVLGLLPADSARATTGSALTAAVQVTAARNVDGGCFGSAASV